VEWDEFQKIREKEVLDLATREHLLGMGVTGGEVDKRIWAAF